MPWTIYALSDPRTGLVRYVGKTFKAAALRLSDHLSEMRSGARTYKAQWLRGLLAVGERPRLSVLEMGDGDGWAEAERRWIASMRATGAPLTNLTDGGDGTPGRQVTPETRARMSAAKQGKTRSREWFLAVVRSKRPADSDATRAKRSATLKGRAPSPQTRAAAAAACRGKPLSPETKAKLRAASTGRKLSPEAREKVAASKRGKPLSEAHKAAISATHRAKA